MRAAMIVGGLALLLSSGCAAHVRLARACETKWQVGCGAAYETWIRRERDRPDAIASATATLRALDRVCRESVEVDLGTSCLEIALVRLGYRLRGGERRSGAVVWLARLAPSALEPDLEVGRRILGKLTQHPPGLFVMQATPPKEALEALEYFESRRPAWATGTTYLLVLQQAIDAWSRASSDARAAALDRVLAVAGAAEESRRQDRAGSWSDDEAARLADVTADIRRSGSERVGDKLASIVARQPGPRAFAGALEAADGLAEQIRLLDPGERTKIDAQLADTFARLFDAEVDAALRAERSGDVLILLALARGRGLDPQVERARRRLHDFHEEHARRHFAAGRIAAARIHARLATGLGEKIDLPTDAAREDVLWPAAVNLRYAGVACPWMQVVPSAPATRGIPSVTITWSDCAATERRWEDKGVHDEWVKELRAVPREVTREKQGLGAECKGNLYTRNGACTWTVKEIVYDRYEEWEGWKPVAFPMMKRELAARVSGRIVVEHAGLVGETEFREARSSIEEEFTTKTESKQFSAETLEGWRTVHLVGSLRRAVGPGGLAHRAARGARARQLAKEGRALEDSDHDAAEERHARALLVVDGGDPEEAVAFFARKYGWNREHLAQVRQ